MGCIWERMESIDKVMEGMLEGRMFAIAAVWQDRGGEEIYPSL